MRTAQQSTYVLDLRYRKSAVEKERDSDQELLRARIEALSEQWCVPVQAMKANIANVQS